MLLNKTKGYKIIQERSEPVLGLLAVARIIGTEDRQETGRVQGLRREGDRDL